MLGCSLSHDRLLPAFVFSQPSCKRSLMTAIALSFLAHGRSRVAFHSPFAIPLHMAFSPHMVLRAFAISQLSSAFAFPISLHTASFPQRSLPAVFPLVVACQCASFHLFLLSLHAAFASSCLFTVPRTWPTLTALAFSPPGHSCSGQCSLGLRWGNTYSSQSPHA